MNNLRRVQFALSIAVLTLLAAPFAEARVTRIVVDSTAAINNRPTYELLTGRAWGTLDPLDPKNAIITDLEFAPRNADGKVEYVASFRIRKPKDMGQASGVLWHDVPNRGGDVNFPGDSFAAGDAQLLSGWQGDDSGDTAIPANADCLPPCAPAFANHWIKVPVARNPDGSSIAGRVMGRILNASGVDSQPMIVHSNPVPYEPTTLDTTQATLVSRVHETIEGVVTGEETVPSTEWAWASCSAANPFPGTPDPTQICVNGGFVPNRVYQVVFTTQDPPVLGIGFAAFRDLGSFFKFETQDDFGTANPLASRINRVIARGSSQSGNFLRALLHLGFNQDEAGRQVQDGNWPIIAGRRVALNFRWAMPDGVLKLYEPGSEGPQWWQRYPDRKRGLPPRGILDRCNESGTCPKIVEHFGAAEVWALKLGPEWVGTDPKSDIPLPENVRRYYIPSTRHGGGGGGFNSSLPGSLPAVPNCPSDGYGQGTFADNPVPHAQTVNAIRFHFRNWVMNEVLPPASRYPTLRGAKGERFLVEPTKQAMGFPTIPGIPASAPTGLINPVLDYDWGPEFDPSDASGVPTNMPPPIKQVIPMLVPRVDADGNELGGVPVVLRDAPLGTYMGWNITAAGFHAGKICNYAGGMVPFARTRAEREANNDPRLSLEERYGTHAGYVSAVTAAANKAAEAGFLLAADRQALIDLAAASNVCGGAGGTCNPAP
ncbi:MAG TPA: alpha/beta hydrolase domain-containing protein [Burkholderiales bacterium]|nr:alpha/beta hydrolase domain-containing protein [Burkholderiales bacterium]